MNIQALPGITTGLATTPITTKGSTNSTAPTASVPTLSSNSAEQTFISLLVTELQSQDPTQPMDPTQMVGQMFSMNQLQQLIDINSTLSSALGGATSSGTPSGAAASVTGPSSPAAVSSNMATSLLHAATLLPANAAASYAQQLLTGAN
jgi:flagellar basal-body rod modification protein FlgD